MIFYHYFYFCDQADDLDTSKLFVSANLHSGAAEGPQCMLEVSERGGSSTIDVVFDLFLSSGLLISEALS